ncbi:MAG: hypothetical protein P0Y49_07050 [Candidatus Pedobacter colombiensis]|uniref:Uncharacterized protein n=1 Tax=Candidatus Pedobacter colombiensis TaxID=3121371 RepID=A0AAJ5WDZ3_9SPHI|nr:hypothetical protein [Pedobacter sp.]WEK20892.1 MAG: hypothetical protein P0Y49_07050 [Pedobacter sp.]
MAIIKNNKTLSAEALYHILKKEFADFVNSKLRSNLDIEYEHVYDVINILFPEIIAGIPFTITVNEDELAISNNAGESEYNTIVLEENLLEFLNQQVG